MQMQADSGCEAEPAVGDLGDDRDSSSSSSDNECRITAEVTVTDVDTTTSCDTDCHAMTPTDLRSHSAAVVEKIQQYSQEKKSYMCDDSVTCATDTVTLADTGGIDQSYADNADSATADTTVPPVSNSDDPVAVATSDSNINHSHMPDAVSSNTECKVRDMRYELEAKQIAVDMPLEDVAATGDANPAAESAGGSKTEPNQNLEDQSSRPNTMLSWSDPTRDVTTSSKPKCAIEFENSVIFDLDVE